MGQPLRPEESTSAASAPAESRTREKETWVEESSTEKLKSLNSRLAEMKLLLMRRLVLEIRVKINMYKIGKTTNVDLKVNSTYCLYGMPLPS